MAADLVTAQVYPKRAAILSELFGNIDAKGLVANTTRMPGTHLLELHVRSSLFEEAEKLTQDETAYDKRILADRLRIFLSEVHILRFLIDITSSLRSNLASMTIH